MRKEKEIMGGCASIPSSVINPITNPITTPITALPPARLRVGSFYKVIDEQFQSHLMYAVASPSGDVLALLSNDIQSPPESICMITGLEENADFKIIRVIHKCATGVGAATLYCLFGSQHNWSSNVMHYNFHQTFQGPHRTINCLERQRIFLQLAEFLTKQIVAKVVAPYLLDNECCGPVNNLPILCICNSIFCRRTILSNRQTTWHGS